jgi:3-phosphoshikimate 1-carboxyvinyltransferase
LDSIVLKKAKQFKGDFSPTPDKSISHRAVIFSSLANGKSVIRNFLRAGDPFSTLNAFRSLGIDITDTGEEIVVEGKGLKGLIEPGNIIDCGNSGTTIRLLSGVLSGNRFLSILTGDGSLRQRPMARVITPLRQMGADILARSGDKYPPLVIRGTQLKPMTYTMPVASAQVKSAILLAGLYAEGCTEVIEPLPSRDHTERMLPALGADVRTEGLRINIRGGTELHGGEFYVPGDFSSAAFFLAGASLVRNAEITVHGVGVNPTRTGLLNVLSMMGADLEVADVRDVCGEPVADIYCRGAGELKAFSITREDIPALIDEFPVLCVAATQAAGVTTITGAEELRVKESDRISSMAEELAKMGASVEELHDGLCIRGGTELRGASVNSHGDHRIAMALSIAALIAEGETTINGISSVNISFPGFYSLLGKLVS